MAVGPRMLQEAVDVHILQAKCREANAALDELEEDRDRALLELQRLEERRTEAEEEHAALFHQLKELEELRIVADSTRRKQDEQIKVLTDQNKYLSQALQQEETCGRTAEASLQALQKEEVVHEETNQQQAVMADRRKHNLATVLSEIAREERRLRAAQEEALQLEEAEQRFMEKAKADRIPLEDKLRVAKEQNIKYLEKIQQNEARQHKMTCAMDDLTQTLAQLLKRREDIKAGRHCGAGPGHDAQHNEVELGHRKEMLEQTVAVLRQSLNSAQELLGTEQEGTSDGVQSLGHLSDKVEALTEQLCHSQEALQRKQAAGLEKLAKLHALEAQSIDAQREYEPLVDARLQAETLTRSAGHTQATLLNKSRMLEEALRLARTLQEQAENRLHELKTREISLQNDNDYLAKRIDGFEDDKGAMLYELRRLEDESRTAVRKNSKMVDKIKRLQDQLSHVEAEKSEIRAEINCIRGEDMLDESGRVKPIVLESESPLMEQLQINEFLLSAQAERNPVPLLVEKISEILGLLHTTLAQADLFQEYVQDSHRQQSRLRQKNMVLDERVGLCEAWKKQALQKIVSNEFELRRTAASDNQTREGHVLCLDGLEYQSTELEELCRVIRNHEKQDEVKVISLRENLLDGSSVPLLCELLDLCPYLRRLDLRHNKLDEASIEELAAFVSRVPGTSTCERDPSSGDIITMSGAQARLVVSLEGQGVPAPDTPSQISPALVEPEGPKEPREAALAASPPPSRWAVLGAGGAASPGGSGARLARSLRKLQDLGPALGGPRSPSSASTGSLASTQMRSLASSWSSSSPGSWTSPSSSRWWSREGSSASSTPSSTSDRTLLWSQLASPSSTGGRQPNAPDASHTASGKPDGRRADKVPGAGSRSPSSSTRTTVRRERPSSHTQLQGSPSTGSATSQLPPSPHRSPGQKKAVGSVVSRATNGARRSAVGRTLSASPVGADASREDVTLPRIASLVALSGPVLDPNLDIDL